MQTEILETELGAYAHNRRAPRAIFMGSFRVGHLTIQPKRISHGIQVRTGGGMAWRYCAIGWESKVYLQ